MVAPTFYLQRADLERGQNPLLSWLLLGYPSTLYLFLTGLHT